MVCNHPDLHRILLEQFCQIFRCNRLDRCVLKRHYCSTARFTGNHAHLTEKLIRKQLRNLLFVNCSVSGIDPDTSPVNVIHAVCSHAFSADNRSGLILIDLFGETASMLTALQCIDTDLRQFLHIFPVGSISSKPASESLAALCFYFFKIFQRIFISFSHASDP